MKKVVMIACVVLQIHTVFGAESLTQEEVKQRTEQAITQLKTVLKGGDTQALQRILRKIDTDRTINPYGTRDYLIRGQEETEVFKTAIAAGNLPGLKIIMGKMNYKPGCAYILIEDAVEHNQPETLDYLLGMGKCPRTKTKQRRYQYIMYDRALGCAVRSGKDTLLERLLGNPLPDALPRTEEVKKDAQNDERELLQLAIRYDKTEAFKLLVKHGLPLSSKANVFIYNRSLLKYIAWFGRPDILTFFCQQPELLSELHEPVYHSSNETALDTACIRLHTYKKWKKCGDYAKSTVDGYEEVINILRSHGVQHGISFGDLVTASKRTYSPMVESWEVYDQLWQAVEKKDTDRVNACIAGPFLPTILDRALLPKVADKSLLTQEQANNYTFLFKDIEKWIDRYVALMKLAVEHDQSALIEALLSHHAFTDCEYALSYRLAKENIIPSLIQHNKPELLEIFLNHSVPVHKQYYENNNTISPLFAAVNEGSAECLALLLAHYPQLSEPGIREINIPSALVDNQIIFDQTPLDLALILLRNAQQTGDQTEITQRQAVYDLLVAKGARISPIDDGVDA